MIYSMTGYGRAELCRGSKTVRVELRSLNSKQTDLRLRLSANFQEREAILRKHLLERLQRGKLEVSIQLKDQETASVGLNEHMLAAYAERLQAWQEAYHLPKGDILQAILRLPGVVEQAETLLEEGDWELVMDAVNLAIEQFIAFRQMEGKALEEDFLLRVSNIRSLLEQVAPFEAERIERVRKRLMQNLDAYLGRENVDENRFEQEVIFYLEKMDITEEKVRLAQHCDHFLDALRAEETQKGRKLGFIVQEMGREINTLGAKAYSSDIQRLVVQMKDELEKIKEQIANVL